MTGADKTQVVTIKVQVPTFSPYDAAAKYLPQLMEAVMSVPVGEGRPPMRIRGATIGGGR